MEKMIDEIYQEILRAEQEFIGKPVLDIEKYVAKHLTEQGYRKQEWISVEDRLPPKHELVLTYYERGAFGTDFITSYGEWFEIHENGKPTHWQPLPTPPKMKGADNEYI